MNETAYMPTNSGCIYKNILYVEPSYHSTSRPISKMWEKDASWVKPWHGQHLFHGISFSQQTLMIKDVRASILHLPTLPDKQLNSFCLLDCIYSCCNGPFYYSGSSYYIVILEQLSLQLSSFSGLQVASLSWYLELLRSPLCSKWHALESTVTDFSFSMCTPNWEPVAV